MRPDQHLMKNKKGFEDWRFYCDALAPIFNDIYDIINQQINSKNINHSHSQYFFLYILIYFVL